MKIDVRCLQKLMHLITLMTVKERVPLKALITKVLFPVDERKLLLLLFIFGGRGKAY